MNDQFILRAKWAARRETPSSCAERTQQMMHDFANCHGLLDRWHELADWHGQPTPQILPTHEGLVPHFEPVEPIASEEPRDAGFSFHCWNGASDSDLEATLRIDCGNLNTYSGMFNQVWLDLPFWSPKVETLYQPQVLECIMRAVVNSWNPGSVELASEAYDSEYNDWKGTPRGTPFVGWFTYLSADRLGKLAGTPPCDEVIKIPDRGSLFIISREHLFSIDNPDDIARIQALTAYLKENHALEPLPMEKPRRGSTSGKSRMN